MVKEYYGKVSCWNKTNFREYYMVKYFNITGSTVVLYRKITTALSLEWNYIINKTLGSTGPAR